MNCPVCAQKIEKDTIICPACGSDVTPFSDIKLRSAQELELIKEKSVLKGRVVELEAKEVRQIWKVRQFRSYFALALCYIFISHCYFKPEPPPKPRFSYWASSILKDMYSQFYSHSLKEIAELSATYPKAPFVNYYVNEGDNLEYLANYLYNDRTFIDTLVKDNLIPNRNFINEIDSLKIRIWKLTPVPARPDLKRKLDEGQIDRNKNF